MNNFINPFNNPYIDINLLLIGLISILILFSFTFGILLILKRNLRYNLLRKSYGWCHFCQKEGINYWEIFKTPFLMNKDSIVYKGITYALNFGGIIHEGIKTEQDLIEENKKFKSSKEKLNKEPSYVIFDKKKRPHIYFQLGNPNSIQFGQHISKFRNNSEILKSILDQKFISSIFRSKTEKYFLILIIILTIGLIVSCALTGYYASKPPEIYFINGTSIQNSTIPIVG